MNQDAIIYQIFKDRNIVIKPIIGRGDVNKVYIVKQKDKQYIVRLNEASELPRFKKEAWCLEEAAKLGIPSPEFIDIGITKSCAYMILSFILGANGNDIDTDKEKIWHIIGTYAKKINSLSTNGFGENMASPGVFSDTWMRYLTYNIESLNQGDKLLELFVLTKEQSQSIKEKFIKLLEKHFTFGLVHGDLSLENIIVENDNVTLIDWGVAESTIVPHMEFVDLLQNQMSDTDEVFKNFLNGYGISRSIYDSIKPDVTTLTLLQAIDKLRWAIDRKPDKIVEFSQRVSLLVYK